MGSSTAAAVSGPTLAIPVMPSADPFSETTGAPGRRSCQSRIDSPGADRGDRQARHALHGHLPDVRALAVD